MKIFKKYRRQLERLDFHRFWREMDRWKMKNPRVEDELRNEISCLENYRIPHLLKRIEQLESIVKAYENV